MMRREIYGTVKHGKKFTFSNPDNIRPEHHVGVGRKKVKCLTNGKIYGSVSEAAKELGLNQGSISNHINKGTKDFKGYKFEFVK